MARPRAMTEDERSLISQALREKAEADDRLAGSLVGGGAAGPLAATFRAQAERGRKLADLIDNADLIDVWPFA